MKWILLSIIFCSVNYGYSQNLVPNSSFEQYIACPTSWGQLDSTENWYKPTYGTSDYYHTCSNQPGIKVPDVSSGFQQPKTGNAFAGILNTYTTREYLAVKLKSILVKDAVYEITCWLNLANDSKYTVSKADIGIYFSKDSVGMPQNFGSQPLPFVPQLVAGSQTEFITDTMNWTKLTFQYKASGNEQFMVFGLFGDSSEITFLQLKNFGPDVYYYVDDFSMVQTNTVFDLKADFLVHNSVCFSDSNIIHLRIQNKGIKPLDFTMDTVLFTTEVEVNGVVVQNFDFKLSDNNSNPVPGIPLAPDSFMSVEIFPVDLGRLGQVHEVSVTSFFKRDEDNTNDTTNLSLIPILDVGDVSVFPKKACSGETVNLQTQNYIGRPVWQYSTDGKIWNNLSPGATSRHQPTDSTYYRVEICGFIHSDSVLVKVPLIRPPKNHYDTVCMNTRLRIEPGVGPETEGLRWFGDMYDSLFLHAGFDYGFFVDESKIFYIQSKEQGCWSEEKAMVSIYAKECPLLIPNVFTPNGDGINDFFIIGDAEGKELKTKIYNRWGVEVANFKGNEGWGGAELPAGVYFYVVQEMKNGQVLKTHKGEVTIVR